MFNPLAAPESPVHRWQGASGRWYIFSVYPLTAIPSWLGPCNYIFARPRWDQHQSREPFYIGEKGDTDRFDSHEKIRPAVMHGATELHVHLLAESRWERLDVETDLRNAHWTPLNDQPTRAREPVNALAAFGGYRAPPTGGGILGALGRLPVPAPAAGLGGLAAISTSHRANPLAAFESYSFPNALLGLGKPR